MQPVVRFVAATIALIVIILAVWMAGAWAGDHIPFWVSGPLILAVLVFFVLGEFRDKA